MENAKRRLTVAFDFFHKLGINASQCNFQQMFTQLSFFFYSFQYWTFHDRDIAPEGETLEETNRNLDEISDYAMELMKEKGVKLLWNTCNLFAHPR